MKAGIKSFFLAVFITLPTLASCKPEYTLPDTSLPELPAGAVLWLDLTRLNSASTSDTTALHKVWDSVHIAATLQGIVNRDEPLLYLNYVENEWGNADEYWWNIYSAPGEWLAGRQKVTIYDPFKACEMLRDKFEGLVVYDPKVPATSCLASTIAGVENLVAVRYDPTPGSFYTRFMAHEYPVKVWLVNPDGTSIFKSKTDVYNWAIENYLAAGKCNTEYAAYYIDQFWMNDPGAAAKNHHQLSNHDYFVGKKAFFFDLSPWDDEVATDDPQGTVGGDYDTMKKMLLEIYRQNGNGDTFCHIGGFPAWPFKYTNSRQIGGRHKPTETEWKFAEIIGEYNAFHDADAANYGALANASFWQHFPLHEKYTQKWVTRDELKAKGYLKANGKLDRSKRYVLLYVGDYDAAAWIYQTTQGIWDDTQRGKVPMMWSVSPILARRAPQAMHYMWTRATENDYFAAADNGAGYLNPGSLEVPRNISGLPDGMQQWAAHCKPWYEKFGITVSGFVIDGNARMMSNKGFKAYATFSPNGVVPQRAPQLCQMVDNMPIFRGGASAGTERSADAADVIRNAVKSHTECPFYWFRAVLKTPSWYVNVYDDLAKNNPEIVWTSGPEFFELMRCYLEEQ